jgi:integrase
MPNRPKVQKQKLTVVVNGVPVAVTLHPPAGSRRSWYAYWSGLATSKSTGQAKLEDAILAAEAMVRGSMAGGSGDRPTVADAVLTDEEFEAIQRAHFGRRTDPKARARAAKSLEECLDAINAFRAVTDLSPVAAATSDHCAAFQRQALTLPKNWRKQYPKSKKTEECISPNTVLKWSRCLQSAFERVNRSAGRKCVRGIVAEGKLLAANPWNQFTWIEGRAVAIRQFDASELLGLLSYLEDGWQAVPAASAAIKVFLWSGCRKLEVAGLTWDMLRIVEPEYHFEIVGKWGVERWFRIPEVIYRELVNLRTSSPFVFAAYTEQIRRLHAENAGCLKKIREEFTPANFGRWLYERVKDWAEEHGKHRVFLHVFRKTALQHARRGEDINRQVAADAQVGERVMMTSYVKETDAELRAKSNRTYARLVASMSPEVARRYGYAPEVDLPSPKEVQAAVAAGDWKRVVTLASCLQGNGSEAG